ncbi:succinoglycan biosynthesis protein ExoL [Devosia sp. YR412]|uniref:glycosyltransferase n=1 Tax=Devosia sp. YR412 TaxID=1881030 RepID=UPI0008D182E9|nr:glycosyltransferase [Devosia sp. YR412]SEQ42193.1 succinoglycan biosynthesis protein ExoL [Devosia sp. YR412]
MPRILYLVHNLADPAVARRIAMLQAGGATVDLVGFRRGDAPKPELPVETMVELDITHDGRMLQRLVATLGAAWRAPDWSRALKRPDVIMARNLEMLGVANRLVGLWGGTPALVYESLDIHRLLLRSDGVGQAMRGLEQRLMRRVDALITSSPAFLRNHFHVHGAPPTLLVENKVFAPGFSAVGCNPALLGDFAPMRLGWFGALRCSKSLAALDALSRHFGGGLEVTLRGRPALTEFADFHATTTAAPHLNYAGTFRYPDDLAEIYSDVHFVWAIDFFEEGQNSNWLLPNRIYEGCLNGAVPIALAGTETAAFIERLGIGVVVPDIRPETLIGLFEGMTAERMQQLAAAVASLPRDLFRCSEEDCAQLVAHLSSLKSTIPDLEEAA